MATMSFSAVVLFYEGFVYNMIFLRRILPALGNGKLALPLGILFNSVYAMAAWSYIKVHCSDPGKVPDRWQDFVRSSGENIPIFAAVPQWQPGKVTYCKNCDRTRPERAHHCHTCDICVARYDHHCLWINNCVGFKNHKFFLLLGMYCCLGLFIALVTSLPELLYCLNLIVLVQDGYTHSWDENELRLSDALAFLVFGILGLCIMGLLGAMLWIHVPRTATNTTAPEANYNNMLNPFDRGSAMANMEQVFGAFGPDWFFPVAPYRPLSDGLAFQHSTDPQWFSPESLDEIEDLWRLRYYVSLPDNPKKQDTTCGALPWIG